MLSTLLSNACCSVLQFADIDSSPLQAYAGRIVRLRAAGSSICLRIGADGSFEPLHAAVEADATIEMPLLAGSQKPTYASGDPELLAACKNVFEAADLAPDAICERLFGIRAGSLAANACDQAQRLGRDGRQRLASSLRSWLIDEAKLVPDPSEMEQHRRKVEEFALRVEKLRQTIAKGNVQ